MFNLFAGMLLLLSITCNIHVISVSGTGTTGFFGRSVIDINKPVNAAFW